MFNVFTRLNLFVSWSLVHRLLCYPFCSLRMVSRHGDTWWSTVVWKSSKSENNKSPRVFQTKLANFTQILTLVLMLAVFLFENVHVVLFGEQQCDWSASCWRSCRSRWNWTGEEVGDYGVSHWGCSRDLAACPVRAKGQSRDSAVGLAKPAGLSARTGDTKICPLPQGQAEDARHRVLSMSYRGAWTPTWFWVPVACPPHDPLRLCEAGTRMWCHRKRSCTLQFSPCDAFGVRYKMFSTNK